MDDYSEKASKELSPLDEINEENVEDVIAEQGANAVVSDELLEPEKSLEELSSKNATVSTETELTDPNESDSSETETDSSKSTTSKVLYELWDWIKSICIGLIVGVLLVVFVIQRSNVHGPSMESTLFSGDVILTEKISTYFDNFDRGDIVVLDGSDMEGYDSEDYLVKRVIGLPGETIKFENGSVYIKEVGATDFALLNEPYLDEGTQTNVMSDAIEKGYGCITLGDDEYFCLGDNRGVSNDSRRLGPFSSDRIKGVAVVRLYPFDSIRVF